MTYEWKGTLKSEAHFLGSQFSEQMRNELDEVYRKAEAFDYLYAEFEKGDKDLSKADFDEVYKGDR